MNFQTYVYICCMMNYIYTLSFDGKVFYVGVTYNPVTRYMCHISSYKKLGHYIYPFIKKRNYPELNILHHTTDLQKSYDLEKIEIWNCIKNGVKLINSQYNTPQNILDVKIDKKRKWPGNPPMYTAQARDCFLNYIRKIDGPLKTRSAIEKNLIRQRDLLASLV